jgi:hypothetical protein
MSASQSSFPHQKLLAAPYAGPYQVVAKGAKTFTIPVGHRQEIVTEDCLKAQTGFGSVSPAEAAFYGCTVEAGLSYSPACNFMKPQTGGPMWRSSLIDIYLGSSTCLLWRQPKFLE